MEWLPEGHLAYFVLDVVGALDLSAIDDVLQSKDARGTRPYSPRMMTALILYAYCVGVFSSRKIERATYEDVAFRVIAGGGHPFFTTISDFRLEHRKALSALFLEVLKLCERAGLQTVGHVSLDGTKVQANASKHKAMSYGRMKDEDKRLAAEIETMLFRADETDRYEDEQFGADKRGDEVPDELRHREGRLRKIREAMAELEKEAAEARAATLRENATELHRKAVQHLSPKSRRAAATLAAQAEKQANELSPRDDDDDDDDGPTQLSLHRVQVTKTGKPKDKAQRNFTDGDSRIMIRNGVFVQAYNAQAAVSEDQIIVAHGVTNDPTDAPQLKPMLERVRENCGRLPEVFTADSGYISEENITYCATNGVDAYIATTKRDPEILGRLPMGPRQQVHWEMHEKLVSPRGKEIYARRKVIAEPVFGQIKHARGFRRFSLRGLEKVPDEWGIVSLCHNLVKLFRRLGSMKHLAAAPA